MFSSNRFVDIRPYTKTYDRTSINAGLQRGVRGNQEVTLIQSTTACTGTLGKQTDTSTTTTGWSICQYLPA